MKVVDFCLFFPRVEKRSFDQLPLVIFLEKSCYFYKLTTSVEGFHTETKELNI